MAHPGRLCPILKCLVGCLRWSFCSYSVWRWLQRKPPLAFVGPFLEFGFLGALAVGRQRAIANDAVEIVKTMAAQVVPAIVTGLGDMRIRSTLPVVGDMATVCGPSVR